MDPRELANEHLGEYKEKYGEINAKHCPFCGPNKQSDNQYKFYMNRDTGAWKCYRANKCGREGSFYDLLEHFDELEDRNYSKSTTKKYKKSYKKPEVKTNSPSGKVADYLTLRCISEKTWKQHNVKEKDGNIAFEYYHNNEKVLVKYRTASKKQKNYWQEGGGKPVLWEIDQVDVDKPLVITEGELDKLAIHEAGYDNVVSVPFGTNNFKWVQHCWETMDEIDEFIIWADNDEAGQKMKDEIVKRLGEYCCKTVNVECNDANVMLFKKGKEAVKEAIENAEAIPIAELKQLDEIEKFDPTQIPKVKSNIKLVNKYLGGFMEGMITIWTGTNGSGKSTFLNLQAIEAVEQDKPTCIVSGKLPNSMLRYWLEMQAAGPKNIKQKYDEIREDYSYYVAKEDKQKIRKWSKDKLFIYDSFESLKPDAILDAFKAARQRYDVRHFMVDNLMIVNFEASHRNKYTKQAQFVKRCKDFAKNNDAHVHIVAHPRKPSGVVTKEDIAGLYEVTNHADNVVAIHRITDENKSEFPEEVQGADSLLDIFKCRLYGRQNILIEMMFNEKSKRFFQYGDNEGRNKSYGWEDIE